MSRPTAETEVSTPLIVIDPKGLLEAVALGDRSRLADWIGEQYVEDVGRARSVQEWIAEKTRGIEEMEPSDQIDLIERIEADLMALPMRDFDRAPAPAPAPQEMAFGTKLPPDTRDLLFASFPWYADLLEKLEEAVPVAGATQDVPLEHRRYKKSDDLHRINPGRIGPHFIHSWALDLQGIDEFRLPVKGFGNHIQLRSTAGKGTDTLKVVDSCGQVIQTFRNTYDFQAKTVDLRSRPKCKHDAQTQPFTRIYLVLETSADPAPGAPRYFELTHVQRIQPASGAAKAYVLADEINYDYFDTTIQPPNVNDFFDARDTHGNPVKIYPPWAGGIQGSNSNLKVAFKQKPSRTKGWYLFGINATYSDQGYFSVVYYNEIEARFRVYLYNLSGQSEHKAHIVKLYFEGITKAVEEAPAKGEAPPRVAIEYGALQGSFFPVDPNPKHWWRAELVVSGWKPNTWTAVDVPVLYPMGSNLPAEGDHAVGALFVPGNTPTSLVGSFDRDAKVARRKVDRYRSLFEDGFKTYQRNVRLVVSVRSFDLGYGDFDLVASAVGKAVLTQKPEWYEVVFDAIKAGSDYFGYVESFGKIVKSDLQKTVDDKTASAAAKATADKMLKKLNKGFTIIGSVVGAAGAIVKLFGGAMSTEATTLAVTLAIRGKITGTMKFDHIERTTRFYLPGRFSMLDFFHVEGIASDNIPASIDSAFPRYERPIGLFGYAFPPWEAEVNLDAQLRLGQPIRNGVPLAYTNDSFMIPSRHEVFVTSGNRASVPFYEYDTKMLPDLLPVIVNPMAEIDVIPSKYLKVCEYDPGTYRFVDGHVAGPPRRVNCSRIYCVAHDRAASKEFHTTMKWSGHTGWPALTQHDRTSVDPFSPPLRVDIRSLAHPVAETEILPLETRGFLDRRGLSPSVYYSVVYGDGGTQPLDWNNPDTILLTDVQFHWDMSYVYWGDTRYPGGGATPRPQRTMLNAPVTLRLLGNAFRPFGKLPAAFAKGFDSFATLPNDKTYVTRGGQYIRYSDENAETADSGYPKPIKGNWGALPAAFEMGFDCILTLPNGKIYITCGDEYVRYSDDSASQIDSGYPRKIKGNWGKLPKAFYKRIDAAALLPNDKLYLVSGETFVRYSSESTKYIDAGYPQAIAEGRAHEGPLLSDFSA